MFPVTVTVGSFFTQEWWGGWILHQRIWSQFFGSNCFGGQSFGRLFLGFPFHLASGFSGCPSNCSIRAWSNEQGRLISNDTNNSSDDDANATGYVSVNFKVLGHSDMLIFLCEGPIFSPYHLITVAPLHRCTYQNFCNGFDMVFASYFPSVGFFTLCIILTLSPRVSLYQFFS